METRKTLTITLGKEKPHIYKKNGKWLTVGSNICKGSDCLSATQFANKLNKKCPASGASVVCKPQ